MSSMPKTWQARWIDPELRRPGTRHEREAKQPASYLHRRFTVNTTEKARLYITCHGLYVAFLNGKRVGDFVLAPGTGDYRQRLTVQCYDVTDLLREGENQLTVTLGDGWYRGNVGIDGLHNYYGTDLALLCQLEVDGTPVLCSDGSWEASQQGPVRENDLELGKPLTPGWRTFELARGRVRDFGFDHLLATESVPILEQERFPGSLIRTPNGKTVVDFGQNLAGYPEVRVYAREGQRLTLWHGETLDENGNFTQANFEPGERNRNGGIPQKLDPDLP